MSKLLKVEAGRMKSLLASIPIIITLILSIISIISFSPITHATAPTYSTYNWFGTISGSTCYFASMTGTANKGLLLWVYSYPNTALITSITDTAGDIFSQVSYIATGTSGTSGYEVEVWYVILVSASGAGTITVNYSPSASQCAFSEAIISQPIGINSFYGGIATGTTNSLQIVAINVNQQLSFTAPANSLVLISTNIFSYGLIQSYALNPYLLTTSSPLIWINALGSCANPCTNDVTGALPSGTTTWGFGIQGSYFTTSASLSLTFNYQSASAVPASTSFADTVFAIVLSTTSIGAPSCSGYTCTITGGGTTRLGTTKTIKHGVTYFYTSTTPTTGIYLQNVTTLIHDYTNATVGYTTDTYYLVLYTNPTTGTQINSNNPLTLQLSQPFTITTGSTNVYAHWYPNLAISPSYTYAIGIISSYKGLTLYKSSGVTMENDTTDSITSGVMSKITIYQNNPSPLFLGWYGYLPSQLVSQTFTQLTTYTCVSGSTCITSVSTITQTQTSYLYSLQGSNGAMGIVQDVTAYIPLWIFPLLLGAWFGLVGLFMGLIIGVGMGTAFGIVPTWLAFLIGLGLLYMMSKLH